jgi:hypothetical protein
MVVGWDAPSFAVVSLGFMSLGSGRGRGLFLMGVEVRVEL